MPNVPVPVLSQPEYNSRNIMLNKKLQVWLPLMLSVVMSIGILIGYKLQQNINWKNKTSGGNITSSLQQVLNLVRMKYVDTLNLDSVETEGIEAVVNHLDPHSIYIPPRNLADINADLHGNFSGIGVEYQMINDTLNVVYVLENGPSEKAGIKTGDMLLKVDTVNVAGQHIKTSELRILLRGKQGSKVNLTVLQNGQAKILEISRGTIPLPSLDAAYMATSDIGYIRLNKFSETTYLEFMDAATGLLKKGMKKMILDLRGNGGGLLEQATNIADELLPDGKLIVSTRGSHVKTKEIRSTKPGLFEEGPLVLLMDEFSASASEVLAGALQDNDRGTIIGRRSFGKGLVQEQYDLANGGALRLTVARYYTPTGRSIQKSYAGGKEKYEDEILQRFHNGYTYNADSVHAKAFTTKAGKKLFDSGGISPDIMVPLDSSLLPAAASKLYNSNLLNEYTFSIYKQQMPVLKKMPSAQDLNKTYKISEGDWNGLVIAAKKDSIDLGNVIGNPKEDILRRMKALLFRYVWRNEGYYQVLNTTDLVVLKALETLK